MSVEQINDSNFQEKVMADTKIGMGSEADLKNWIKSKI